VAAKANKTQPTAGSVEDFLAAVTPDGRKAARPTPRRWPR